MKNKLLVTLFAAVVAFAFTACKNKSDVLDVNSDLVKVTMHKYPRSLVQLAGQTLTISELEFASADVNDNRMVYREISFGNGTPKTKKEENLVYQYGEWNSDYTSYSLYITPSTSAPYTMWYRGNAFVLPDGRAIGGEGTDNTARVEKWEKTIATFPNTNWDGTYRDKYVLDSIFRDSIRTTYIPPMTFIVDTIKIFTGKMDTLSSDTTVFYKLTVNRDAACKNTGHFYMKSARTKYNRDTKTADTISSYVKEYDFDWYFSDVSSDAKFSINLESKTDGQKGDQLDISKYKTDSLGVASEFLCRGAMFYRPQP